MYINKSLSFLEQAILALADRRRDHVPFRQTKLTHALKDSLGDAATSLVLFMTAIAYIEMLIFSVSVHVNDTVVMFACTVSVGGNCNTVLVANIYGEAAQIEETVRSGARVCISKSSLFPPARSLYSAVDNNHHPSLQLSTLRFASRMKCVRTNPAVNECSSPEVSSHTTRLLSEGIHG